MKVCLLHRDTRWHRETLPASAQVLCKDLELEPIFRVMAGGDELVGKVCRQVLLEPLSSEPDLAYRQEIQRDVLARPQALEALYGVCLEAEEKRSRCWYRLHGVSLSGTLSSAMGLLKLYREGLEALRRIADRELPMARSEGLQRFYTMLEEELPDDYLAALAGLEQEMDGNTGVLLSARFGGDLQSVSYVCRRKQKGWRKLQWVLAPSYTIGDRDDRGAADLSARKDRALEAAADSLARAAEHLECFFDSLRQELAFWMGTLHLYRHLQALHMPLCMPELLPAAARERSWTGLYDGSLAILQGKPVVGNDLPRETGRLWIITGANQGGKTTFLRSLGQAQLMAQSGMFVFASACTVPLRQGIFTHFKKEEDAAMTSGRLDEELTRMSGLVDCLRPDSLLLSNESFSSTNEREGAEIFCQISRALLEARVELAAVTHLLTYAQAFRSWPDTRYLRAERLPDGVRTYRVLPGEPLETAFGADLYERVFGEAL